MEVASSVFKSVRVKHLQWRFREHQRFFKHVTIDMRVCIDTHVV